MSDVLVSVDNVSKKFCRSLKKSLWYGLQDMAGEMFGSSNDRELRTDEFWAVKDVSFDLKRGECLGLIGRNGAGKTTLLRMLNGLIKPDHGRIEMRGRVGSLIALGAGFNPILSGRENIYVNASILGLTKREIEDKVDEIINFAELNEFIDMPVQNYSSGMTVRLGFAIATALEPDVLLLDEVLAVGDAAFRFKCHRRISQVLKRAAVVFVSHDMPHIARISSQVIVFNHGEIFCSGKPHAGIEAYCKLNEHGVSAEEGFSNLQLPVTYFSVEMKSREFETGSPLNADILLRSSQYVGNVSLRLNIFTLGGIYAADCVVDSIEHSIQVNQGMNRWCIEVVSLPLKAGRYQLSFSIADCEGEFLAVSYKRHEITVTGGHPGTVADCQLTIRSWTECV